LHSHRQLQHQHLHQAVLVQAVRGAAVAVHGAPRLLHGSTAAPKAVPQGITLILVLPGVRKRVLVQAVGGAAVAQGGRAALPMVLQSAGVLLLHAAAHRARRSMTSTAAKVQMELGNMAAAAVCVAVCAAEAEAGGIQSEA
jgi:hypothetical protein